MVWIASSFELIGWQGEGEEMGRGSSCFSRPSIDSVRTEIDLDQGSP
jgi:hypothetical protein